MPKTHLADQICQFYSSLVRDVEELLEMDEGCLSQDLESLTQTIRSRGPVVVFYDLPQICSDLERSLEIGWYKQRHNGALTSFDGFVPKLFRDLYLRVFSEAGVILEEPSIMAVKCLRQLLRCFKKFDIPCPDSATQRAIDAFVNIEDELPNALLSWGRRDLLMKRGFPSLVDLVAHAIQDPKVRSRLSSIDRNWSDGYLLKCASFAQAACDQILGKFNFSMSSTEPKHGPGAVSEKYSISKFEFPSWGWRLEKFFPFCEWGIINYTYLGEEEPESFRDETSSKLIAVPKDYKGPRLIASEPISAQYVQQAILKDLRRNVRRSVLSHSIDFHSQLPSQQAALAASKNGRFATIDLSSASDRLSCAVVECAFRRRFSYLEILNSARTDNVAIAEKGLVLSCKKFAAQGAAFTFPVQSIIYAILAIGCLQSDNPWLRLSDAARKVRVFGDDIIVPEVISDDVKLLLTACHLVVNEDKSFSQGSFRESCGMDAFRGSDVTPAYVRKLFQHRQPTATLSTVECSNNLYLKGYIRASAELLDYIPQGTRRRIPWVAVGSNTWGIVGSNIWTFKTRYNRNLQRLEARCLSVMETSRKLRPSGAHRLHQWFIEEPMQDVAFDPYRRLGRGYRYCERWVDISLLGR